MAKAGDIRAGGAFIEIGTDSKSLEKGLGQAKKSVANFTLSIKGAIAGAIAVGGFGHFVKSAISAASSLDTVKRRYATLFKGVTGETDKWISETSKAFKVGESSLAGYLNNMQDLLVPMGFARDDAAKLGQAMTRLGMDFQAFSGVPIAEAMNDINSALVGMTRGVRKYGIVISDMSMAQSMAKRGMNANVSAMSDQEKVYARMAVIMDQSTDSQGASARNFNTFSQAVMRFKEAWGDFLEEVGTPLLKILSPVVDKIGNMVMVWKDWIAANPAIITGIAKVIGYVTSLFAAVSQFSAIVFASFFGKLLSGQEKARDAIVYIGNLIDKDFGDSLGNLYDNFSGIMDSLGKLAMKMFDATLASFQAMVLQMLDFARSKTAAEAENTAYGLLRGTVTKTWALVAGKGPKTLRGETPPPFMKWLQEMFPKPAYGEGGDMTPSEATAFAKENAKKQWAGFGLALTDTLGLLGFNGSPPPPPGAWKDGLPSINIPGLPQEMKGKFGTPSGGVVGFLGSRRVGEMLGIGKGSVQEKQLSALEAIKENTSSLKDGGMAVYA